MTTMLTIPDAGVTIRPGVLNDVPFLDSLQRVHTKQVGWMPRAQFEGKIKLGHVLIAEEALVGATPASPASGELSTAGDAGVAPTRTPVGYLIGNDQYFKRDDVGIIYQMNVLPGKQRGLIGASLLKAQFEKSAWGCRLYCCWCAQDIAANQFWEAMGFVPLAFRTGSEKKARMHIFWQKRIRGGDVTTPWWFPSQTSGGSIREDRIVLPIPPGTHWSDAKPLILPGMAMPGDTPALPAPKIRRTKAKPAPVVVHPTDVSGGGFRFAAPPTAAPLAVLSKETGELTRLKKVKQKNDPRLVVAARELRDRWLDEVNTTPLLPCGKYDVCRAIEGVPPAGGTKTMRLVDVIDAPALPALAAA